MNSSVSNKFVIDEIFWLIPISDLKDTKSEELSFQGANFLLYIPQTSAKFTGKLLDFLALESLMDSPTPGSTLDLDVLMK